MLDDQRIAKIAENVRARNGDLAPVLNALCMAEEMGEAVQQIRRHEGHARRPATCDEVGEEMADVIISTAVTAQLMGIDLGAHVRAKLDRIMERGGR